MAKKYTFLIILLVAVVFAHSANANPLDWLGKKFQSKKIDVKTYDRDLARPLIFGNESMQYIGYQRSDTKEFVISAYLDIKDLTVQMIMSGLPGKSEVYSIRFTSMEHANKWIGSTFPDLQCWSDYGIEKCKK